MTEEMEESESKFRTRGKMLEKLIEHIYQSDKQQEETENSSINQSSQQ